MNIKTYIHKYGYIKSTTEYNRSKLIRTKDVNTDTKEMIEMCLSCKLKRCNGNCLKIRSFKSGKV